MAAILGLRREDKNKWEQRTPIIPDHIKILHDKYGIHSVVQPSPIRSFMDDEYKTANASLSEDLSNCQVIFAVKEIPKELFEQNKTYVFFSHVIKGQQYNMPMLKELMKKQCTLIDYEKIVDENNRRLIFFGKYAGIAGMVDTLYTLGQRLKKHQNISNPFESIKRTYEYPSLKDIKNHISEIGNLIKTHGLPEEITPLIVGFAGYGNVSKGAQEINDLFPFIEISPDEISSVIKKPSNTCVYKVVFKEEDMVQTNDDSHSFNLQEYYEHPELYHSVFDKYIPYLSILMNCIYWDERYPRLITKKQIKEFSSKKELNLQVIGDISVDIGGGIEATAKVTTPDNPSYVYQPQSDTITDNMSKDGIAIMAVDNLPCELPKDSSEEFSNALYPFIPAIVKADYSQSFEDLQLPPEIKNAVILHKGCLTPSFEYINNYL
ncbi:MAG: hypothetical protein DRN27_04890 [Thermoplasmata archaeon]|nr:MAG: hypothetical protein DRN27_04890 [Thermoplasmata archaeon]